MFSFQIDLVKLLLLSTQATVKCAFLRDKKFNVIKSVACTANCAEDMHHQSQPTQTCFMIWNNITH